MKNHLKKTKVLKETILLLPECQDMSEQGKMIKKLNARMDGGDLLTLKKAKTAGICINFCVGKWFFVVLLFSGGVHEQPEEAQEIFEEELIDQLCPPEVCR